MTPDIDKTTQIRNHAKRLKLPWLYANASEILHEATTTLPSYDELLYNVLQQEINGREERLKQKRYKDAQLPMSHDLNCYDFASSNGVSVTQMKQLRELHWIEEGFNLMLSGPSGVGKTFIAAGLCADAIEYGYKSYFRSMDEILSMLKLKDVAPSAKREYKKMCSCDLLVIDDLMNLSVTTEEGHLLFAFINKIYECTSFIITTNKSPADWARSLNDEVLATALLDRLLYKCELIQMSGASYRMTNRKTIFNKGTNENK